MLKEFNQIAKLFNKKNIPMQIFTNAINYNKEIDKSLSSNNESFVEVSLDCGSRETFKRIKKVDKFNNVIANIKKYIKSVQKSGAKISLKYIILPEYNTNKDEVEAFFQVCKKVGCKIVYISLDYNLDDSNNTNIKSISQSIYEIYDYFLKRATELELEINVYNFVKTFLKQGKLNL